MGRCNTGAITTKECLRIELSYLLKSKLIQKNKKIASELSWTSGAKISIITCLKENDKYIRLIYTNTSNEKKSDFDYKINLRSLKSNLGVGEVLYFECPTSGKRCRVLYSAHGCPQFKSRNAHTNKIYYNCQIQSKYDYWCNRYWDTEKKLHELKKVKHKKCYRGRLTKPIQRIKAMEKRLDYYEERKDDIFYMRLANWGKYLF